MGWLTVKAKVVIIAGMHRSGTSMIARFFHHSGISMGDKLMGADDYNPYGHYEDMEFYQFQRDMIKKKCGHSWVVKSPPSVGLMDCVRARWIIRRRRNKDAWGWKDPRTCLFLDLWDRLLPEAFYLHVFRHPLAVADSLARREGLEKEDREAYEISLAQWLIYNREVNDFYKSHKDRSVMASLEQIIVRPEEFTDLISNKFGFNFRPGIFRSLYDDKILKKDVTARVALDQSVTGRECGEFYQTMLATADL